MKEFKYAPLNSSSSEIRLVTILPGPWDSILSLKLSHHSRSPTLIYEALSYTWDDPYLNLSGPEEAPHDNVVGVNGHGSPGSLHVHSNLALFFRHIRKVDEPSRMYWIDAVCINQEDLEERGAQVLRMREIYEGAMDVRVWLGPEKEGSAVALGFIRNPLGMPEDSLPRQPTMSSWEENEGKKGKGEEDKGGFVRWGDAEMKTLEDDVKTGKTTEKWNAVIELFKRGWWNRTWVVQEVYLAQAVIFMCGHETAGWDSLWWLLENLWVHSRWTQHIIPSSSTILTTQARTILWLRQKKTTSPKDAAPLDLLKCLYHLRPSKASDPRDKVFGLLGLAVDARQIVPRPDYSLTLDDVYKRLLETMTKECGNLDWLTLAGDSDLDGVESDDAEGKPSWRPDLTKRSSRVSINTSRSVCDGRKGGGLAGGFLAARDSVPDMILTTSLPSIFDVKGFVVDMVDGVGPIGFGSLDEAGNADTAEDSGTDRPQSTTTASATTTTSNRYETPHDAFDAIWTTLVADQDFEGTPSAWRAPYSFRHIFSKHIHAAIKQQNHPHDGQPQLSYLGQWYLQHAPFPFAGRTIEQWAYLALNPQQPEDERAVFDDSKIYPGFERRMRSSIGRRRLISTATGWLGLANDATRVGDKVCILFGGRMPVILRPVGNGKTAAGQNGKEEQRFRFLGECYVHGLMLGWGMEMFDAGESEERRFCVI